jgi:zinc transporter
VLATETGLVIVLRGINRNAGANPADMVSVRFWVEPDRMISVRQRKVMSASKALAFLERGDGPATIADLLTRLIELLADGIAVFVDDIEARIEKYDSEVETADPATVRSEISEVRQGRELSAAPDIQAILIQSTLASLQIEPVAVSL